MATVYGETIRDHARRPRNYGLLRRPDLAHEDLNPLCGDRIRIELQLTADSISAVGFAGDGCIISIGAASLLTEMIKGWLPEQVAALSDQDFLSALETEISPSRTQCALLALNVLRACLDRV